MIATAAAAAVVPGYPAPAPVVKYAPAAPAYAPAYAPHAPVYAPHAPAYVAHAPAYAPHAPAYAPHAAPAVHVPVAGYAKAPAYDADYDANPSYSYAYDVQDAVTGDSKSQHESRQGNNYFEPVAWLAFR